jgi:hypothetical protein
MGFPVAITDRYLKEGDLVALKMLDGNKVTLFPLLIETLEYPNNYYNFSLGSATALASAGTGWNTIQDSNNRYILEPEYSEALYQVFYGVSPPIARLYRQYPSGVDRGSLVGTRNPGTDPIGYINGDSSPMLWPSPVTEFFTVRGQHPAFYGHHPYARPATITVRMNFYITAYGVCGIRGMPDEEVRTKAKRIITMGGRTLMQAPGWVKDAVKSAPNGQGGI